MGVLRSIVQEADSSEKVEAAIKENLAVLVKLAETKSQLFEENIRMNLISGKIPGDTNLEIPITKVLAKKVEYRAISSIGDADVAGNITKSLSEIFSDRANILNGLSSIISSGLNTIMGTGEGEESEYRSYYVVAEYPAIVRFDICFWLRAIKTQGLQVHLNKVLTCVAYKSAVNIKNLDFNDFLALYGPILNRAFGSDLSELDKMIERAEDIYKRLGVDPREKPVVRSFVAQDIVAANSELPFSFESETYPATVGNF